jgi:hypothetical protein
LEELQTEVLDLKSQIDQWKYIAIGLMIGFGVLGALISYFFKKATESKVNESQSQIEKRLATFELAAEDRIRQTEQSAIETINEKKHTIEKLMLGTSTEQSLLYQKKIYLWGESNPINILKILRIVGFNMQNLLQTEEESQDGYQILFINNETGMYSPAKVPAIDSQRPERDFTQILDMIKSQGPNVCVFYYNSNQASLPIHKLDFDLKHRVNFATNPSQIYGNLMNMLKYQDRLEKESQI